MIVINDYISYVESSENPLSSMVYIIKGSNYNYIFDVGASKEAREIIKNINNRKIIISHFHTDHMENLKFFTNDIDNLYIGDYTKKILGYGNLLNDKIEINDGINLKIIPIQNCHAKGSLCVIINDKYLLIGDSLDGNRYGFNVTLLNSLIKFLKNNTFEYVLTSHSKDILKKEDVIKELEYYYSNRDKNKPYIGYDSLYNYL